MNGDERPGALRRIHAQAEVPATLAGQRLDQVAAILFDDFSRSRLGGWIREGRLRIDGRTARPRDLVAGGEQLSLEAEVHAADDAAPEDIPLVVVHEDTDLLVIDKPAGFVVHPGAGNPVGTLQNALLHLDPALAQLPRAGIVHRLDKDTTGLMVVARTLEAHAALVEQLSARAIHREYEAVVEGVLVSGGTVDAPLDRHPVDRRRRAVRPDGKPAVTHYRVTERYRAHTLLRCILETGRTHQIRVHLAHLRHPIVGDPVYGAGLRLPRGASPGLASALRGFRRQALHARRLELAHPRSGAALAFEATRPADFAGLCAALAEDARA